MSDLDCGPKHFGVSATYSRTPGQRALYVYIYGPGGGAKRKFPWYNVRDVVGNASRRLALEMWEMVDEAINHSLTSGHSVESLRADREALWRQCFVEYVLMAARAPAAFPPQPADDLRQLADDLSACVQVQIYGPEESGGYKGMREAPRSNGYCVSLDAQTGEIKITREDAPKDNFISHITEIGAIHIWTSDDGPNIFWEREADKPLKRSVR